MPKFGGGGGRKNMIPPEKPKDLKKSLVKLVLFGKKYWFAVILALLCSVGSTVLSLLGPGKIKELTSIIEAGMKDLNNFRIDMDAIAVVGFTLLLMYGLSVLLHILQNQIMVVVANRTSQKMRSDISRKINRMPLNYFDTNSTGDTLSRITNDVDTATQSINQNLCSLISAVIMLLGSVVIMFVTQPIMALTTIVSSLIGFVLMSVVLKASQKHFVARQQTLGEVNGHIEEYFSGQHIVRAYNAEEKSLSLFSEGNEKLRKHTFLAEFFSGFMMPIMSLSSNISYVAVCIVGAALAFGGTIDFAVVVAFILYVRLFSSPLNQIAGGFSSLQSAAAAGERVFEFLGEEELSPEKPDVVRLNEVKGNIEFNHVTFGYRPDHIIIHDFSAKVQAGQKIAIVGPTGAGKTTLVNLLMRFYELNSGFISVDGINIADITRTDLHDLFGMVLQDTWLFEGTLRDNLCYGKKNISDERLHEILDSCGLHLFVSTLPNGLDTVLNDNVSISAGQKQLITIARAMVENAPMLILDEATSSVDTRTEQQIQNAMETITKGRTSFFIAHRLSTIKNADMIIYMEKGDIKETGSHEELLAKNGLYAKLYNSQFETV